MVIYRQKPWRITYVFSLDLCKSVKQGHLQYIKQKYFFKISLLTRLLLWKALLFSPPPLFPTSILTVSSTLLFCPLFPTPCCTFEGYVLTHGLACWEQPFGKCGLIFIMTAFIVSNCTIILVGKIPWLVKNVTFLFQKCCYHSCYPKSSRVNDCLGSSFWRARTVKRGRKG